MIDRRRGEALMIGLLLASGLAGMALLRGASMLMDGFGWTGLALTLGAGILLALCLLVALFLIYQLDKRAGRVQRTVPLFELATAPTETTMSSKPTPAGEGE